MRRDVLLLQEMIEACVRAVALVEGQAVEDLAADRIRRDALMHQQTRVRNRIVHGYWSIDLDVVRTTAQISCLGSALI